MTDIPREQRAVQLVGPNRLELNPAKPVPEPGPHQLLCRVIVVGLCFSDLKLLMQFSDHARKGPVIEGVDPDILSALPSYVPGDQPAVPGHEPVVEVVQIGRGVEQFKPGERYFVQADWRWLRTAAGSNGAFGYNFEGALQEYVLMDERILFSPEGECMLMPAPQGARSASAFALVEPWACVEQAYQVRERTTLRPDGKRLIVADDNADTSKLIAFLKTQPKANAYTWCSETPAPEGLNAESCSRLDETPKAAFDDILYFGANPDTAHALFDRCAQGALLLLMRGPTPFGRPIEIDAGGIHYRGWRMVGTPSFDPAQALAAIPETGEFRKGDRVHVVGAGGPMGVMHVVRALCEGIPDIVVHAADISDERLAALSRIAEPLARENGVGYQPYNSRSDRMEEPADYTAIMAPIPELAVAAVQHSAPRGVVNIFAGIPLGKPAPFDVDAIIDREIYLMGTSGSLMEDMRIVLSKVEQGRLDTNVSVAAVSGLDGAIDGIRAVEKQAIAGKIMVYPACKGLELTTLEDLGEAVPDVAAKLENGVWAKAAEDALLQRWDG